MDWSSVSHVNTTNVTSTPNSTQEHHKTLVVNTESLRNGTGGCDRRRKPEYELIRKLLNGYDKNVRPVRNKQESIEVSFDLAYNQLVDLVRNTYFLIGT